MENNNSLDLNNPGMVLVRASEADQLPAELENLVLKEQQLWQRVMDEQGYFVVYSPPCEIGEVIGVGRLGTPIGSVVVIAEASFEELHAQALRYHPHQVDGLVSPYLGDVCFYRVVAE